MKGRAAKLPEATSRHTVEDLPASTLNAMLKPPAQAVMRVPFDEAPQSLDLNRRNLRR